MKWFSLIMVCFFAGLLGGATALVVMAIQHHNHSAAFFGVISGLFSAAGLGFHASRFSGLL